MSTRQTYGLAIDRLAYMIGYAPHFPARRKQTFSDAFVELCGWLEALAGREKRPVSSANIAMSREAAARAKRLFDSGDDDAGLVEIQYAYRYLELAKSGKPAIEPLFEPSRPPGGL